MRIALVTGEFVTESNFDGGLANYIYRLAISLRQLGHQVVVVVGSDHNGVIDYNGIEIQQVHLNEKIILKRLKFLPRFIIGALLYLYVSWKLNNRIHVLNRDKKFNVVQYPNLGGISLFRTTHIPAVVRISSYTPLFNQAYQLKGKGRQQNFWEMLAMRFADGVFCPSQRVANVVQQKTGIHVRVIESPFLVDVDTFDNSIYLQKLIGKRYLLFFGTIGILKGVLTIADVLPRIFEHHPDLYFVFVGKETAGVHDGLSIMEYVTQNAGNFSERVLYLGPLHHEQLYPILDKALAVVLPSRLDNFPNTCLEAMAFKKVVVGTYGTSFEQLIDDGQSGFLCKIDDADDLEEAIENVINLDDSQREWIGNNAHKRIEQLRPERVVTQLVEFYDEIVTRVNGKKRNVWNCWPFKYRRQAS